MNFQLEKSVELLSRAPKIYRAFFYELKSDWGQVTEGEGKWSAYNIVGHLIHGEKTDWIPRAKIILGESEDKSFEPYDRFAQEKLYATQTIEELLREFETVRASNLKELNSWNLTDQDLQKEGIHPEFGKVSLKELLATWTIHDQVHLNQISRTLVKHYAKDIGPWANYINLLKES